MEILKENVAYLSNYEVSVILEGIKRIKPRNRNDTHKNELATITYETIHYLEETPCKRQNPEKIKEFMKSMQPFKLTKGEKLSLLNLCPTTELEIQLIIEDSEERLSKEEVDSLLMIVVKYLGDSEQQQQWQQQQQENMEEER